MLTSIQSAGVAPEVNLRTSAQARKRASEKSTLALKPRAVHVRDVLIHQFVHIEFSDDALTIFLNS